MPRKRLPARLKLRERDGRNARWVIVDGAKEVDTGCGVSDSQGAEEKLGEYIAQTRTIDTSSRNPAQVSIADVIALYIKHKPAAPGCYHATPLLHFFGLKTLKDVNGQLCRAYEKERAKKVVSATVRRELGTLQAAINFWHVESPLEAVPKLWKPEEGKPRERVLSRSEVARMLWACRRLSRTPIEGGQNSIRYYDYSHVARFILIALYTGTRHVTVLKLRWYEARNSGWIDWQSGILHRSGSAEKQTRKRRNKTRIPDRLMFHIRRWAKLDLDKGPQHAVIRYHGRMITRQQNAWDNVITEAGLGRDVTPHVLKHTGTTWLLQAGMDLWDVSGLTSTSTKTLETVYGHHSPEFQKEMAKAFRRRA